MQHTHTHTYTQTHIITCLVECVLHCKCVLSALNSFVNIAILIYFFTRCVLLTLYSINAIIGVGCCCMKLHMFIYVITILIFLQAHDACTILMVIYICYLLYYTTLSPYIHHHQHRRLLLLFLLLLLGASHLNQVGGIKQQPYR